MSMIRLNVVVAALSAVLFSQAVRADEPLVSGSNERGFSYFLGLGHQRTHYSEDAATVRAKSSVSTGSALLITGALYAIKPDFLVSLDNTSTFAPGNSTETWRATSSTVPYYNTSTQLIEDRAVNGPLLQQNRYTLSQSSTRAMAFYRASGPLFLIGGANLHTQSFRRYSYQILQPAVVANPTNSVVEETSSEVLAEVGVGLESERVRRAANHYSVRATVGRPVWRSLTNTNAPDLTFTGTQGWDVGLEGRYSVAIHDIAHLGLWGQYLFSERARQVQGYAELPKTHTRSTAVGIELLWKL